MLRVVSGVAQSPALSDQVRHAALAHVLTYAQWNLELSEMQLEATKKKRRKMREQRQPNDTDWTQEGRFWEAEREVYAHIETLCAAVSALLSHGAPPPSDTVATLVPLLEKALQMHSTISDEDAAIQASVYGALTGLFRADDAIAAAFARNDQIDTVLQTFEASRLRADSPLSGEVSSVSMLCECASRLDNATLESVFTGLRRTSLLTIVNERQRWNPSSHVPLTGLLARLGATLPWFAQELLSGPSVALMIPANIELYPADMKVQSHLAQLYDNTMVAAEDKAAMAFLLCQNHAIRGCVGMLNAVALWPGDAAGLRHTRAEGSTVAVLLRVLRRMFVMNDDSPVVTTTHDVPGLRVAFAEMFRQERGPQSLDILRFADCLLENESAFQELAQLREVLTHLNVVSAADPVDAEEDMQQTVADLHAFAHPFGGCWREAHDAYIAHTLEDYGYPRRLQY